MERGCAHPNPRIVMSFLNQSLPLRAAIPIVALLAIFGCGDGSSDETDVAPGLGVAEVGLQGPRAVIYDPVDDVYLVSNVAGGPLDEDENGFVSRVSPDGEVLALQWSPPVGSGDTMDAPKGMAIRGDTLFITDIGCVHLANRLSGGIIETRCLDDVTSLSGIDVAPEGSLFLTDGGYSLVDGEVVPSSTDAVYRLTFRGDQRGATLARGPDLNHPTGVAVGSRGIFVTSAGGDLFRFTGTGERTSILASDGQAYEGVVFVSGGGFAYSSSTSSAVYLVDGTGAVTPLASGVDRPGDLGFDSSRNRVLVPLFDENRLVFLEF